MVNDLRERLRTLLAPAIEAKGFELVDIELDGQQNLTLRVFIDSPDGVTVDDCAEVSHQVSAVLDVEDPLPGRYTLEVSSPGLDRPLVKPADFRRYLGETIKVRMVEPIDGRKNFQGDLLEVADDYVLVNSGGLEFRLKFAGIDRARLVPKF